MSPVRKRIAAWWRRVPSTVRKPLVTAIGSLLIVAGCIAIVLPGPWTIPPVLAGLAILGTEYHWARRLQQWIMQRMRRAVQQVRHPGARSQAGAPRPRRPTPPGSLAERGTEPAAEPTTQPAASEAR